MLTVGGLQGFVFYAAEQLARTPGRVLVEAPSYDRPLKILGTGRGRGRRARDGRGRSRSGRTRRRAAQPQRAAVVPVHDPDVPEPEREDAVGRTPCAPRRDRPRARARGSRGRPVRARPLRGRARGEPSRARGRGARHVHVVVLEDGRARRPQRVLRPPRGARGGVRGAGRLDLHLASVPAAGGRPRVRRPRPLRAEPRRTSARSCGSVETRCSAALEEHAPAGTSWSHPTGGYFVWVDFDGADAAALAGAAEREGVAFIPGGGFFPHGSGGGAHERTLRVQLRDARSGSPRASSASCASSAEPRRRCSACGAREAARRGSPRRSRCRRTGG